jgi:predicted DNA-binding protein
VPILKAPPKQTKNESLQLRVSTEFKLNLHRYSEFISATPAYVVIEALNRIFEKDRDFKTWLGQYAHTTEKIQSQTISAMETTEKA